MHIIRIAEGIRNFRTALGALLLCTATAALAESETASLDISATVPAACKVGEPDSATLAVATAGHRQLLATSSVEVNCSLGTPYRIRLNIDGTGALQPADKRLDARPIAFSATLAGSDRGAVIPTLHRIGTGAADPAVIQIDPHLTGREMAGSYREQLTLTIDW